MATVIVFANQKGGVGKTTSAANLGAALAMNGQRVLLIDADPQCNLSELFGVDDPREPGIRLEDALETAELDEVPEPWSSRLDPHTGERVALAGGVHLLPCTEDLAHTAIELAAVPGAEHRMARLVAAHEARYDFVLVDTPPGLGTLSSMALLAARWVIVPARPADFDVGGAVKVADLIDSQLGEFNSDLELLGVLITQTDRRWTLRNDTRSALKRDGIKRLHIEIPFMVRVGSAPRYAAPTTVLEPDSRVGRAYRQLAADLAEHLPTVPATAGKTS